MKYLLLYSLSINCNNYSIEDFINSLSDNIEQIIIISNEYISDKPVFNDNIYQKINNTFNFNFNNKLICIIQYNMIKYSFCDYELIKNNNKDVKGVKDVNNYILKVLNNYIYIYNNNYNNDITDNIKK